MPTGDFDPFDHFGHDRMNMKDGDKGSIKSERVILRVGFFILWIFFAIVYPYLDYGFIDWMFAGFISIGFGLFGLIVIIGNYFSPPSKWNNAYSDNVLTTIMEQYGITQKEKFISTLHEFDHDENGYFKRSEIEEAA